MFRAEASALPLLSTGKPSLVQITAACAPGRVWTTFLEFSSINTIARPFSSWPVTTRRMVRLMGLSLGDGVGEKSSGPRQRRLVITPITAEECHRRNRLDSLFAQQQFRAAHVS